MTNASSSGAEYDRADFVPDLCHALRSPLQAMNGFAQALASGASGSLSDDQRELVDWIVSSGRRMRQILADAEFFARLDCGLLDLELQEADPRPIVSEVVWQLAPLAAGKGISVTADVVQDLEAVVTDPARLKDVISRFLANALTCTPVGGHVDIRVHGGGTGFFRVDVADTGSGIAQEDLGRLFLPFERLQGGACKDSSGAGLGLALTRRLVEAMGGHVSVRTAAGSGAVFSAILPRTSALATGRP